MLHMAQHRYSLEPFEADGKKIEINTNFTADSSVRKILLENASRQLSSTEAYMYQNMILNIWSLFVLLMDENVASKRNASGVSLRTHF